MLNIASNQLMLKRIKPDETGVKPYTREAAACTPVPSGCHAIEWPDNFQLPSDLKALWKSATMSRLRPVLL